MALILKLKKGDRVTTLEDLTYESILDSYRKDPNRNEDVIKKLDELVALGKKQNSQLYAGELKRLDRELHRLMVSYIYEKDPNWKNSQSQWANLTVRGYDPNNTQGVTMNMFDRVTNPGMVNFADLIYNAVMNKPKEEVQLPAQNTSVTYYNYKPFGNFEPTWDNQTKEPEKIKDVVKALLDSRTNLLTKYLDYNSNILGLNEEQYNAIKNYPVPETITDWEGLKNLIKGLNVSGDDYAQFQEWFPSHYNEQQEPEQTLAQLNEDNWNLLLTDHGFTSANIPNPYKNYLQNYKIYTYNGDNYIGTWNGLNFVPLDDQDIMPLNYQIGDPLYGKRILALNGKLYYGTPEELKSLYGINTTVMPHEAPIYNYNGEFGDITGYVDNLLKDTEFAGKKIRFLDLSKYIAGPEIILGVLNENEEPTGMGINWSDSNRKLIVYNPTTNKTIVTDWSKLNPNYKSIGTDNDYHSLIKLENLFYNDNDWNLVQSKNILANNRFVRTNLNLIGSVSNDNEQNQLLKMAIVLNILEGGDNLENIRKNFNIKYSLEPLKLVVLRLYDQLPEIEKKQYLKYLYETLKYKSLRTNSGRFIPSLNYKDIQFITNKVDPSYKISNNKEGGVLLTKNSKRTEIALNALKELVQNKKNFDNKKVISLATKEINATPVLKEEEKHIKSFKHILSIEKTGGTLDRLDNFIKNK